MPRLSSYCLFLAIVTSIGLCSQTPQSPTKVPRSKRAVTAPASEPVNPLLQRARDLTAELEQERENLRPFQDALLPARLADIWWKLDKIRAQRWLSDAITQVTSSSMNETDDERDKRLKAVMAINEITSPLDRTLSDKLLSSLTTTAAELKDEKSSRHWRMVSGLALETAAAYNLPDDLQRGIQIGDKLIELKSGFSLVNHYWNLRFHNPVEADKFFLRAVSAARATYDFDMLFNLAQGPFPFTPRPDDPRTSDEAKQAVLSTVAEAILRPAQTDDERKEVCKFSSLASHLLPNMPPAEMGAVQTAIQNCAAAYPKTPYENPSANLKTPDDLLHAAESENDPRRSAFQKQDAASRLSANGDPLSAVDVMIGFTSQERENSPMWPSSLEQYALATLELLHKRNDFSGIQQLLDRLPDKQRIAAQIQFVIRLTSDEKNQPYALTMFTDTRRRLEKNQLENPRQYLYFLRNCAKLATSDMPQVLKLVVAGLNGVEETGPKTPAGQKVVFHYGRFSDTLEPVASSLADMDPEYVRAATLELTDPGMRICFRLGYLYGVLARYQKEIAKTATRKTASD